MGTINQFNKPACGIVSEAALDALQDVARKFGLTVERRSGSYTELTFTAKFEFKATALDGKTAAQKEFETYCGIYDLKPEDFGQVIRTHNGETVKIAGLAMKRSKFPIVCENVHSGKKLMYTRTIVDTYHRQQAALEAVRNRAKAVQS